MVETTVRPWLVHSKDAPGSNGPSSRRAAVMSVCQAGQSLTSVCSRQTVSSGALMSISWRAITGASRSMPVGVVLCVPFSAGVVAKYVDAGVAFGQVDHAAAVD